MNHPTEPIDIPAAWMGADMAEKPETWTYCLSVSDIEELESAARGFLQSGRPIDQLSVETFPLPRFATHLRQLQETLRSGIGFEVITGLPVANYTLELAATIFCGLGAHLGSARSQNAKGHVLGHVKDTGANANNPNVRIYQTAERQSFHTDSADVVGLLCLNEAKEGGDSLLVSTVSIFNHMLKIRPDLAAVLFEPLATDRRGEVPEGAQPWFEIPVLNWHEGHLSGLFQRQYIDSAARFKEAPALSDLQVEALDMFEAIANDPDMHLRMRLRPGDMQFVYNHSNLHDRTGFVDHDDPEKRRHLLRLWLSLPDDRPLPPVFAQRYGSLEIGNRGGIITKGTRLHVPLIP